LKFRKANKNTNFGSFGPYDLLKKIGSGSSSNIWHGRNRDDGSECAVKVLNRESASRKIMLDNFLKEIEILKSINHKRVSKILNVIKHNGKLGIIMTLESGVPLTDIISDVPMGLEQVLSITEPLASCLDHMHLKKIAHRDIKPANILYDEEFGPKLIDFGISDFIERSYEGEKPHRMGSDFWMAPEQADHRKTSIKTDNYSFAMLLYRLLTGGYPWESDLSPDEVEELKISDSLIPIQDKNEHLGEELCSIIMKGLSNDPNERPSSCLSMVKKLKDEINEN
jgi:serine/threonine protein kinase